MKKRIISILLITIILSSSIGVNAATMPFTDIYSSDWYYDSIAFVYGHGLMAGTTATTFEPNANIKREAVVVLLGRIDEALGYTVTASSTPFTDVNSSAYYYKYVGWAYRNNIVNGISSTQFGVGQSITRQDFCVGLYRYANYRGITISQRQSISFSDSSQISSYAVDAVSKCANGGIINGYTDGTFRPQNTITRAEIAHAIMQFLQYHVIYSLMSFLASGRERH